MTRIEEKKRCNCLQNNLITYYDNDNFNNDYRNIFFLLIRFVTLVFKCFLTKEMFLYVQKKRIASDYLMIELSESRLDFDRVTKVKSLT